MAPSCLENLSNTGKPAENGAAHDSLKVLLVRAIIRVSATGGLGSEASVWGIGRRHVSGHRWIRGRIPEVPVHAYIQGPLFGEVNKRLASLRLLYAELGLDQLYGEWDLLAVPLVFAASVSSSCFITVP